MAVKSVLLASASRIADDEPFDSVDSREMSQRAVATEIAAALRLSDRTIESHMGTAARLQERFPATAASFGAGRVDLLADLVLTGTPAGHETEDGLLGEIRAHIDITVPVLTLTDLDEIASPAHLEGVGPIDPATARILTGNASGFDRVLTHPVPGMVLGVDRYRPSAEMRRYLRARDRRCRFPGCRLLARLCDGDHTIDHALGGATTLTNLADFCRRHHVTKHETPWRVRQLGGGVLEWTSPTGRTYVDRPPGVATYITFEDVAERMPSEAPF